MREPRYASDERPDSKLDATTRGKLELTIVEMPFCVQFATPDDVIRARGSVRVVR